MKTKDSFFTYWTKRNRDLRALYRSVSRLKKVHFDSTLELLKKLEYRILKAQSVLQQAQKAYRELVEIRSLDVTSIKRQVFYPLRVGHLEKRIHRQRKMILKLQTQYVSESRILSDRVQIVVNRLKHTPHPQFTQSVGLQKVVQLGTHCREPKPPAPGMSF